MLAVLSVFLPIGIHGADWKSLRSNRLSAVQRQRSIASQVVALVIGNACSCRGVVGPLVPSGN